MVEVTKKDGENGKRDGGEEGGWRSGGGFGRMPVKQDAKPKHPSSSDRRTERPKDPT